MNSDNETDKPHPETKYSLESLWIKFKYHRLHPHFETQFFYINGKPLFTNFTHVTQLILEENVQSRIHHIFPACNSYYADWPLTTCNHYICTAHCIIYTPYTSFLWGLLSQYLNIHSQKTLFNILNGCFYLAGLDFCTKS